MATVYARLLLRMTVSLTLTRLPTIPGRLPSRGNENLEALSSGLSSLHPLLMPRTLLKERERTT